MLYDSQSNADTMENHLDRAEVRQALATGTGESSRYSSTLMERQLYAAQRLADGTVIRLSGAHLSLPSLALMMIQPPSSPWCLHWCWPCVWQSGS